MEYLKARGTAEDVCSLLAPACERIRIAGSIRRQAPEVKDIEIVYITRMVPGRMTLFGSPQVPAARAKIYDLVARKVLRWDDEVKRNGPKYKRLIHCESGMVVECFRATWENWGLIFALRTGPAAFNKALVAKPWAGGVMPVEMRMQDGRLWRLGSVVSTPTEREFFEALGLPLWPPDLRSVERLKGYVTANAAVARFE